MKKLILPLTAISILAVISCNNNAPENKSAALKKDSIPVNRANIKEVYTCPMDTDYHSDKPGTCPKCGMELVKQTK